MKIQVLLMIVLLPILNVSLAQEHCNCNNFRTENPGTYKLYEGVSQCGTFVQGQSDQIYVDIYKGKDYRISFYVDSILRVLGPIKFKILDQNDNILYDNYDPKTQTYEKFFELTCVSSQKIKIEVTAPGWTEKKEQNVLQKKDETIEGCFGIIIEHAITPVIGF